MVQSTAKIVLVSSVPFCVLFVSHTWWWAHYLHFYLRASVDDPDEISVSKKISEPFPVSGALRGAEKANKKHLFSLFPIHTCERSWAAARPLFSMLTFLACVHPSALLLLPTHTHTHSRRTIGRPFPPTSFSTAPTSCDRSIDGVDSNRFSNGFALLFDLLPSASSLTPLPFSRGTNVSTQHTHTHGSHTPCACVIGWSVFFSSSDCVCVFPSAPWPLPPRIISAFNGRYTLRRFSKRKSSKGGWDNTRAHDREGRNLKKGIRKRPFGVFFLFVSY